MPYDRDNLASVRRSKRKAKRKVRRHHKLLIHWRRIVANRQRRIRTLKRRRDPAAKAAKFLIDRFGWHEDPGRQNRAAWLDIWSRLIGEWMVGQPWCGLAVWMAARQAGVTLSPRTVSTIAIREMARAGTGGYKAWHGPAVTPKIGYVAIYGTSGPVHTGMYVGNGIVGEGNTSPGTGGSQNDGGGLYPRKLAERRGWLLGWAEIDWEKAS